MEASVGRRNAFRFADPRQERIHRRLLLIGPGPATFYKDACRLVSDDLLVESTTHLVAHLLREIESALRDVLEPIVRVDDETKIKEGLGQDTHKVEIRSILKCLEISEDDPVAEAWLSLADRESNYALHAMAHRRQLIQPRPVDDDFKDFWNKAQTVLDAVLDRFEAHYASVFDTLDKILAKSKPSHADLKQLRKNAPDNYATWSYFFGRLSSAEWLIPLKDDGFFGHPPEPKFDGRPAAWPQSQYLARVASTSPSQVLRVIQGIPKTENPFVHSDFVDAALAMPQELAAKWAKQEAGWLETHESINFLLPQKLGQLVGHLAKGNQVDVALTLAKSLLRILPSREEYASASEPCARFDTWNYEQILQTQLPALVAAAGERAVAMLCDLLESAVQLYLTGLGPKDYSHLWRPAVENSDQNHPSDPKELLVSAVRDAALQAIRVEPSRLPTVVEELEKRKWFIFRRIALHILNSLPTANDALIAERLTDHAIFDETALWHEYSLLAQNHFSSLSPDNQRKILKWIDDGPDAKNFSAKEEKRREKTPTKEETERYVRHWQLSHLAPIHGSLPEEWKSRYSELTKELGEPEHPEFPAYSVSRVGPTSPKQPQELQSLSVAEVVRFLKSWRPAGGLIAPSPEGLGRVLSSVVCADPGRFAPDALQFRGLGPTYVRAMLDGLHEATRQKRHFSWAPVLELCEWVVKQPRDVTEENIDFESDMGWASTRKSIARLLSASFEVGPCELGIDLRNLAWNVLEAITEDPDPTSKYEKMNYDSSNMDPVTLSINTVRGEAIHAVIHYALWVRRHVEKATEIKSGVGRGFDEMPEVRAVLDAHVDSMQDSAVAIRAIYGQWFPWLLLLDKQWTLSKVSTIFTHDASLRDLHDAAWDAYVVYCPPYDNVFDALRDEYVVAVEELREATSKWRYIGADPKERLAEHLVILYWRGKLDLDETIMRRFFEVAPDDLRGHALSFAGRELLKAKEQIPIATLQRLRFLWESRIHTVQSSPLSSVAELSAFGWWFASAKLEDAWCLGQLSAVLSIAKSIEVEHEVLKRLSILAPQFPERTIDCLSLMAADERALWTILVWRGEIRAIMGSAIRSTSKNAAEKTAVLINRLSATGHLEFRDLLNASH